MQAEDIGLAVRPGCNERACPAPLVPLSLQADSTETAAAIMCSAAMLRQLPAGKRVDAGCRVGKAVGAVCMDRAFPAAHVSLFLKLVVKTLLPAHPGMGSAGLLRHCLVGGRIEAG